MANAKKCDRCGNFYEPYKGVRMKKNGTIYSVNRLHLASFCNDVTFDLCPSCVKASFIFLGLDEEKEGGKEE
jgi:hypothetical protein